VEKSVSVKKIESIFQCLQLRGVATGEDRRPSALAQLGNNKPSSVSISGENGNGSI